MGIHRLPLLVIVEDNNYSILTEKKVEEIEMEDVAKAFKMKGFTTDDNPKNVYRYSKYFFKERLKHQYK